MTAWNAQGPGFNSQHCTKQAWRYPSTGRKRQEDQEFRVILSCTVSLRPAHRYVKASLYKNVKMNK